MKSLISNSVLLCWVCSVWWFRPNFRNYNWGYWNNYNYL